MSEPREFTRSSLHAEADYSYKIKKQNFNQDDTRKGYQETDPKYRKDPEILLGAYVTAARVLAGYSSGGHAANATGIATGYWSRLETASTAVPVKHPEELAEKIARALKIDPDWILEPYRVAKAKQPQIQEIKGDRIVAEGLLPVTIRETNDPTVWNIKLEGQIKPLHRGNEMA